MLPWSSLNSLSSVVRRQLNGARAAVLAAAVLAAGSARGENYLTFRGLNVEKKPGQSAVQFYDTGKRAIVRKYIRDLADKEGTTVTLEQFTRKNWPFLWSEFERSRGKLDAQLAVLEEFTTRSQAEKLSPEAFYDKVAAERGQVPGFANKTHWLIFQKSTSLEDARRSAQQFPTTPEAGLAAYGAQVLHENLLEDWTLQQLEKRKPGVTRALAPEETFTGLVVVPGQPLPEDVRQEHERRESAISQAAERLILPQVIQEVEFASPADRKSFQSLMEQELKQPISPELPAELFQQAR